MTKQSEQRGLSEDWMQAFDRVALALSDDQIAMRRHLHRHPEPSGEEIETTRLICGQLADLGLQPVRCRSDQNVETGAYADLEIGAVDARVPRIAIRCDIDALRMSDRKTVEYRSSKQGVAHCCGHDAHTAIVLGLGKAAVQTCESSSVLPAVPLRLRLIFQPSEEEEGGAEWLVDQGVMEGVDRILGVHVDPERQVGRVGIRYGVLTAACDEVRISLQGRGGHAARPHQCLDPIAAAVQLLSTFYQSLPRRVDARHPAVFTASQIQGGTAANVISDSVRISGTLRTTDETTRSALKAEMEQIRQATELSTGANIQLEFCTPYHSVINEAASAAALETAARHVLGTDAIEHIALPSMGGEDFSVYQQQAPGAMLRLGCAPRNGHAPHLHSPDFDIEEAALAMGTRILMRAAVSLASQLRG